MLNCLNDLLQLTGFEAELFSHPYDSVRAIQIENCFTSSCEDMDMGRKMIMRKHLHVVAIDAENRRHEDTIKSKGLG